MNFFCVCVMLKCNYSLIAPKKVFGEWLEDLGFVLFFNHKEKGLLCLVSKNHVQEDLLEPRAA